MLRIGKTTKEISRTGFILTAISEGLYDIMQSGYATFEEIQKLFRSDSNPEGLKAWLDLGVSLGELKKNANGYSIKGKLSKELIKPAPSESSQITSPFESSFAKYRTRSPATPSLSTGVELPATMKPPSLVGSTSPK